MQDDFQLAQAIAPIRNQTSWIEERKDVPSKHSIREQGRKSMPADQMHLCWHDEKPTRTPGARISLQKRGGAVTRAACTSCLDVWHYPCCEEEHPWRTRN